MEETLRLSKALLPVLKDAKVARTRINSTNTDCGQGRKQKHRNRKNASALLSSKVVRAVVVFPNANNTSIYFFY